MVLKHHKTLAAFSSATTQLGIAPMPLNTVLQYLSLEAPDPSAKSLMSV